MRFLSYKYLLAHLPSFPGTLGCCAFLTDCIQDEIALIPFQTRVSFILPFFADEGGERPQAFFSGSGLLHCYRKTYIGI